MAKEQLKSVTLVSLFALCVLLVSQIWSDISLDLFNYSNKGNTEAFEKIQIDQIISPQGYVFNFGGKSHTVNYSDKYQVWQEAKPAIIENLSNGNDIQRITSQKWRELNTSRSIRFELPYEIAAHLFLDFITEEDRTSDLDMEFDQILILVSAPDTVYYGNRSEETYYAHTGNAPENELVTLLAYVENNEASIYHSVNEHYHLKTILSFEDQPFKVNYSLMPRFQVEEIPVVKVKQEIDITDDSEEAQAQIQAYADQAFEGRFDFVNHLQDVDGSNVFIYGYGEKALKLGVYGELEYKEKLDATKAGSKLGLKDSLKVAVKFMNQFGGVPSGTYLKSYQESTGIGNRGYRFTFDYRVQGYPVVHSKQGNGDAIEVEVFGTQVLSYKRLVREYAKIADIPEVMGQQFTIDDVFNMNYDRIHEDYQDVEQEPFDKNRKYQILQQMEEIKIVYYSDVEKNSERLIPAWHIKIGSYTYYFNMHTGQIMKAIRTQS